MRYNSQGDVGPLWAEQLDTKSNVKLRGFDPSLKCTACLATSKICDTTKQFVC